MPPFICLPPSSPSCGASCAKSFRLRPGSEASWTSRFSPGALPFGILGGMAPLGVVVVCIVLN